MKVGVVGLGFGAEHLRWIADCPALTVAALGYHRDRDRAHRLAEEYGATTVTDDGAALAADPELDVVVVASPPHTHLELARPALERGAVVVIDKPLAHTGAAADELADLARARQARTMVTFQWREHAGFQELRDDLAAGRLGDPLLIDAVYHHDFLAGPGTAWPWRHDRGRAGAGALGDLGVHVFDLLRWVTGREWAVTDARLGRAFEERSGPDGPVSCDTDDVALVHLAADPAATGGSPAVGPGVSGNTALARVLVSRVSPGHRRLEVTAVGTAGTVRVTAVPDDGSATVHRPDGTEHTVAPSPLNPYRRLVDDLTAGTHTVPDLAAGAAAQALVDAVDAVGAAAIAE